MTESPLRKGWTTGACAAAAAKAAYAALRGEGFPDPVTIQLPRGETPSFALSRKHLEPCRAIAGVIKDAGDDPDVTHGAEIIATVEPGSAGSGITFRAGEGVGTVTLPGLPIPPGEPAINPGPRRQITDNLGDVDLVVTISIPGGEALAAKTLNSRLGIMGGLSILGTTGVVIPYSCSAWVHSIHRGVDVARALGFDHVAGVTGKTSEALARKRLGLSDQAIIDMGDMAGGLLKYLRRAPVRRLTLVGGFAKLTKLAAGHLDLHSAASQVDGGFLGGLLRDLGFADQLPLSATAAQALVLAGDLPLGDLVARRARETALAVLSGGTEIAVIAVDRGGKVVGKSG
ncbi:cobalt-precorrin-5B (C(1))-methyltransferase [Paramagnetospirillum kuznetsovii]|uniref:Cobalt-precorrin-5B C(1)-methyltransferase n=1 Tax=Paramagnetospirillum kuznetsovii TaxID=2053833 RepID=A0A364NU67_9PROT|nr:cobalt-precorrin-5B (C(1))-methyltransferase [Paramagnetospirillum kuznetsovii]RAU20628.1 cobalt-precorrin-5B (C(1))-methyltransferase [Paramagnetospirillum kuznetsovii]